MDSVPRCITFDADHTLVDFRSALRSALGAALQELRRHVAAAVDLTADDLQATRDLVAAELGPTARMEDIRAAAFRRTLEELGRPDPELASRVTRLYLRRRFRAVRVYDDVVPALGLLRRRFELGLASNGNSYPERAGLARFFSFVVFAHDHGVRKPDPAFFEAVLAAAGRDADEVVHVGDSLDEDVAAAEAVGIRAIWLNREGRPGRRAQPCDEIRSLAELPSLLEAYVR